MPDFVTDGIHAALSRAKEAAQGKDVRLGGGVDPLRRCLTAGLSDELHLAIAPVLLGRGEHLLAGIDTVGLGYACTEHVATDRATHVVFTKRAPGVTVDRLVMGFFSSFFGRPPPPRADSTPAPTPSPSRLAWALEQVRLRTVSDEPGLQLQGLIDALQAVRGQPNTQLFGLAAHGLSAEELQQLEAALVPAILGWKERLAREGDAVTLRDIDALGRSYSIDPLRLAKRLPLRCDPLGTRDGLSPEWLGRLKCLDEVVANTRGINHPSWEPDDPPLRLHPWPPNLEALYAFVLAFETEHHLTFPRELAAVWATTDGFSVNDDQMLHNIAAWRWADDGLGLCIGCGSYRQGELVLEADQGSDSLIELEVVDRDDDGVELHRYANFGAFLDQLFADSTRGATSSR